MLKVLIFNDILCKTQSIYFECIQKYFLIFLARFANNKFHFLSCFVSSFYILIISIVFVRLNLHEKSLMIVNQSFFLQSFIEDQQLCCQPLVASPLSEVIICSFAATLGTQFESKKNHTTFYWESSYITVMTVAINLEYRLHDFSAQGNF